MDWLCNVGIDRKGTHGSEIVPLPVTNLDLKEQAKPKGFSDCVTVHSKVFISIEVRHNVLMHF